VSFSAQEQEPRFSQPIRQILTMITVLVVVAGAAYLLAPTVWPVFQASPYLNGFILLVFVIGIAACFWQVLTLISSVSWIEGFAMDRPGHEFVNENQLGGMGTAFASSLLGLAGSLVVGMLELFAGHGQNRFYTELEEWLSSITRIGLSSGDGDRGGSDHSAAAGIVDSVALQIETLKDVVLRAEENRSDMDRKLGSMADAIGALTRQMSEGMASSGPATVQGLDGEVLSRLANSQDRLADVMATQSADTGQLDAETRMRLRNIDVQLLRILEEMSAGRQDAVAELRTELASIAAAFQGREGR